MLLATSSPVVYRALWLVVQMFTPSAVNAGMASPWAEVESIAELRTDAHGRGGEGEAQHDKADGPEGTSALQGDRVEEEILGPQASRTSSICPSTVCCLLERVTATLRGLASSATGIVMVRTPSA